MGHLGDLPVAAVVRLAAWIAVGVTVMLAVGSVAIWIYAGPARLAEVHHLRIPAGAAAEIAAGGNPLALPSTWELTSGDLLVIDNADELTHTFGSWVVPAGGHLETVLRPDLGPLLCTLHPEGQITLDVRPARRDWALALQAALLLGVPLGLVGAVVARIRRALDDPEPLATTAEHVTLTNATGGLR